MKKIIALLLVVLVLISCVSCAQEPGETLTEDITTQTSEKEESQKKTEEASNNNNDQTAPDVTVEKPLSRADVEAIPIAGSKMSISEARQICVDFFKLSVSFCFKPSEKYNYRIESKEWDKTLEKGKLYGGLPYVTVGGGNLYRILDFYDFETGVLNVTPFKANYKLFGNACSGGASWGWARAINSVQFRWTANMTQANGYYRVGPYTYDDSLTILDEESEGRTSHTDVKNANGEQVMFQSYALCLPADGIVNVDHVRMVSGEPIVVLNEDGTINGEKSFLPCTEQTSVNTSEPFKRTQSDGTEYFNFGVESHNYSFAQLYKGSYLPFTFAEFMGKDPIEDATLTCTHTGSTVTPQQLQFSTLVSNYIIGDVYFSIKDSAGTEVSSYVKRNPSFMIKEYELTSAAPVVLLEKYCDGTYTVEIQCQLGTGQKLTAYTGTLVAAS